MKHVDVDYTSKHWGSYIVEHSLHGCCVQLWWISASQTSNPWMCNPVSRWLEVAQRISIAPSLASFRVIIIYMLHFATWGVVQSSCGVERQEHLSCLCSNERCLLIPSQQVGATGEEDTWQFLAICLSPKWKKFPVCISTWQFTKRKVLLKLGVNTWWVQSLVPFSLCSSLRCSLWNRVIPSPANQILLDALSEPGPGSMGCWELFGVADFETGMGRRVCAAWDKAEACVERLSTVGQR